jgi:Family of unknown function (DUF6511)
VQYRCAICHRPPRGFGWNDPQRHKRSKIHRRFCSKDCQDIFYRLHKAEVQMNHRTDLEQQAAEAVLGPLGDFVVTVGVDKALNQYNRDEITALIDTVLETYHTTLQTLYKHEVPF